MSIWRRSLGFRLLVISAVGILVLVAVVFHPYVLGLRGRIAEARFQSSLHRGMSRDAVIKLAISVGGMDLSQDPIVPDASKYLDAKELESLDVIFIDSGTVCIVNGEWFRLQFAPLPDATLQKWSKQPWGSAC